MSRKRKSSMLLGPDGRPLEKSAPKPPPATSKTVISFDHLVGESSVWRYGGGNFLSNALRSATITFGNSLDADATPRSLKDAVADDIASLTVDFDGAGGTELPAAPRDLTAYRDAFASAAAKCEHEDATEMLYGREWTCDACGRSIGREEMRRIRQKRGPFWGYFS